MSVKLPVKLAVAPSETIPPSGGIGQLAGSNEGGVVYPTFTYRGPLDLDLPEHGEMTIHYRQTDERSAGRPSGERYYECTIQVKKILKVEESKEDKQPSQSYDEASDALDKLAEEREAQG